MLYYLQLFLVGYLAITMLFALAGQISKTARFIARILVCYILLLITASYGVVASIVLRCLGEVGIAQWTTGRIFRYMMCPAIGVNFEVENEELLNKVRPAVFLSNHQSYVVLSVVFFPLKFFLELFCWRYLH